jgi:hypothetical protein
LANSQEISQWLQQGISAAKAGQIEQARFNLLDVVEQDQSNEAAWYWLYKIFDRVDDRRVCLENLIIINPNNTWAKQELLAVLEATLFEDAPPAASAPPLSQPAPVAKPAIARPVTLKLVTAFWFGLSIMFVLGGLYSAGEWLIAGSSLGFSSPIDLTLSVVFVMAGVLGMCVAITLFFQSMLGFYGSLLLALALLLVGPTLSLIVTPPNYVGMTCTGGISGMIVLLTLASQTGFARSQ